MKQTSSRRTFLKTTAAGAAAMATGVGQMAAAEPRKFDISLAAWSFHRAVRSGEIPFEDLPKVARERYDIGGFELVNQMMPVMGKSFEEMKPYLDKLAQNGADHNVKLLLIMVDNEGSIGGTTDAQREAAVENHKKWIDAAKYLVCHSMQMNWAGAPHDILKRDPAELDDFINRSVPGFRKLCDYGDKNGLFVIIENHGGASSHPHVVERLMKAVNHPRFGTLPDFGNFPPDVDNYEAIDILMNYAHKAVSAKCYDFDDKTGLETKLDYPRLIADVVDKHGYHGFLGIEFEGDRLSEYDGVKACKALLEKLRTNA